MFIQTEETPNPQTMKFFPGQAVMENKTAFYTDKKMAEVSPLASSLFSVEEVDAVFLGSDFITVTKAQDSDWKEIKTSLLTAIMEHYISGKPVVIEQSKKADKQVKDAKEDDEATKQIKELIETRVRPAVAMDGGDIIFHSFEDGIVRLEMHGACAGCPSSTMTLKHGIENMLKHYVPEVIAVEPVV